MAKPNQLKQLMKTKCDQSQLSHRPEQLHAGTMPVRTHVDESGLGVGSSIFATTIGKDCVARVILTYAIIESRVINPATLAIEASGAGTNG